MRGGKTVAPFYLIGALITVVFVAVCMITVSIVQRQFDMGKPILVVIAIVSPIMAAISAIGFLLLIGYHVNLLMLISPFLVLALGIGRFG